MFLFKINLIKHRSFLLLALLVSLFACEQSSNHLALGTLERERIAHTATVSEVVVNLPVTKGSQVSKGTILVELDATQQNAQVARATAEVAQAKANLQKLEKGARVEDIASAKASVTGAKATLLESEASYKRSKDLIKKKLSSQADLDRALAIRDFQRANLKSAEEQLEALLNGTRIEDLNIAKAHLDSVIAILSGEQKKLADLTIRATRDGILDNLPWNLGERVIAGSPLAIILAGAAPYARVYVPETYRVKVKVNDKLMVHVDGVEKAIEGTLTWISNEPAFSPYYALNQEERARLMYLAQVQLPESAAYLPNGIPAQVALR